MKYRRKMRPVDAIQFNGDNFPEILKLIGQENLLSLLPKGTTAIDTDNGTQTLEIGDWVVDGPNGFVRRSPGIFNQYYEPVAE